MSELFFIASLILLAMNTKIRVCLIVCLTLAIAQCYHSPIRKVIGVYLAEEDWKLEKELDTYSNHTDNGRARVSDSKSGSFLLCFVFFFFFLTTAQLPTY